MYKQYDVTQTLFVVPMISYMYSKVPYFIVHFWVNIMSSCWATCRLFIVYNNRAISQTVFMLSIAINRAIHVGLCATVIIKHNYMLS